MRDTIQTSNLVEAVDSLQMVNHFLTDAKARPHLWKWVIISLHNAMQGFMVEALLEGTNDDPPIDRVDLLIKPDKRKALEMQIAQKGSWHEAYDEVQWLHTPTHLFCEIQNHDTMVTRRGGTAVTVTASQQESFATVNEVRNMFVHFKPTDMAIIVTWLSRCVTDCCDVIEQLVFASGTITIPPNGAYQPFGPDRIRNLLREIRVRCDALHTYYQEQWNRT